MHESCLTFVAADMRNDGMLAMRPAEAENEADSLVTDIKYIHWIVHESWWHSSAFGIALPESLVFKPSCHCQLDANDPSLANRL